MIFVSAWWFHDLHRAVIGEFDEVADASKDLSRVRADPLKPVTHWPIWECTMGPSIRVLLKSSLGVRKWFGYLHRPVLGAALTARKWRKSASKRLLLVSLRVYLWYQSRVKSCRRCWAYTVVFRQSTFSNHVFQEFSCFKVKFVSYGVADRDNWSSWWPSTVLCLVLPRLMLLVHICIPARN